MGNTGVKVTISAVDRASRTLERINARIAAVQAPVRRLESSFRRFDGVTGFRGIRAGMGRVSDASLGMVQSMSKIVPVLGSITGAASLAGIYRLASAWAQAGTNVRIAARNMGLAPSRLMAMQNAARLAGGSGEAMGEALQNLSQTKWEALHGYAPEAATQFKALGISLEELKNASPDQMFERITKRLRQIRDPAARVIAATKMFGGAAQGLMPILQQSEAQFQSYLREAARFGLLNQRGIEAAARLQHALTELSEAVEGFGNSLAQSVEPALRPVIEHMADWIAANREWIAQDITSYVRQFVTWLRDGGWGKIKTDIGLLYGEIIRVVDGLGGWKNAGRDALIAMAALYAAPVLAGLGGLAASILSVASAYRALQVASAGKSAVGRGAGVMGRAGLAGAVALGAYEVGNKMGWNGLFEHYADKYVPGVGWVDNKLSKYGLGWSYKDQKTVDDWLKRPRGIRNNNPGNLNFVGQAGASLERGVLNPRFAAFPTMTDGIHALRAQLLRYGTAGDDTISRIIKKYAPKNENDTDRYQQYLSSQLGVRAGAHLDLQNPRIMRSLIAGISTFENGRGQLSMDEIDQGLGLRRADISSGRMAMLPALSSNGMGNTADAKLKVEIDHRNAPSGSVVSVKSASPGLRVQTVRQHRAMEPMCSSTGC